MSGKGSRWDNACAERFFKMLKGESDNPEGRRTKEEARVEVVEYEVVKYREPYYNRAVDIRRPAMSYR
jgi:transposase InsO family protein